MAAARPLTDEIDETRRRVEAMVQSIRWIATAFRGSTASALAGHLRAADAAARSPLLPTVARAIELGRGASGSVSAAVDGVDPAHAPYWVELLPRLYRRVMNEARQRSLLTGPPCDLAVSVGTSSADELMTIQRAGADYESIAADLLAAREGVSPLLAGLAAEALRIAAEADAELTRATCFSADRMPQPATASTGPERQRITDGMRELYEYLRPRFQPGTGARTVAKMVANDAEFVLLVQAAGLGNSDPVDVCGRAKKWLTDKRRPGEGHRPDR